MRRRVSLAFVVAVLVAWNAALLAAPSGASPRIAAVTYLAGSLVCHQQPERSFHRAGAQLPVCARCHGLYAGALLGMVGWVLVAGVQRTAGRRAATLTQGAALRTALVVAGLPTLVTVALGAAGIWDAPNVVRWLLALPLGAVIAAAVAAVAAGDLR